MTTRDIQTKVSGNRKMASPLSMLIKLPLIPMTVIAAFLMVALLADFITPHSPYEVSLLNRLAPPFWLEGGSLAHPLGTDNVGRDLFTRLIFGTRVSLFIGSVAVLAGGIIGTLIGLIAGYFGGWIDSVLMRVTDSALALPIILFALLLAIILGPSLSNVVIAITLVLWSRFARMIRGEVLSLRERDFVAQARIIGCSHVRIIVRHLLPNVLNTVIVLLTLQVGWVILMEASLSYLGAGVPAPWPAWGSMVAEGQRDIIGAWWLSIFPGVAILLLVLSFNLLGDWLRDSLDPKLRQV